MIQSLSTLDQTSSAFYDEYKQSLLPVSETNTSSMKNELKSFLKTKMKNTTPMNRDIII